MKTTKNETVHTTEKYRITLNIGGDPTRGSWDYPDGTEGGELTFANQYGTKYELIDYDGCFSLPENIVDTLELMGYDVTHIGETLGYLKTFDVSHDVTYVHECTVKAKSFEDAILKARKKAEEEHSSVRWQTGAFHGATFYEAVEIGKDGLVVGEYYDWEAEK